MRKKLNIFRVICIVAALLLLMLVNFERVIEHYESGAITFLEENGKSVIVPRGHVLSTLVLCGLEVIFMSTGCFKLGRAVSTTLLTETARPVVMAALMELFSKEITGWGRITYEIMPIWYFLMALAIGNRIAAMIAARINKKMKKMKIPVEEVYPY